MRYAPLLALLLFAPAGAFAAAPPAPAGPKALGTFQHWTAATYDDNGQTICYAFTEAVKPAPLAGRGKVLLSVTERHTSRDEVALSAGYTYTPKATVTLSVGQSNFELYTSGDAAFARRSADVIKGFEVGVSATTTGPGPDGKTRLVDSFSLDGFTNAYKAIVKACPAK